MVGIWTTFYTIALYGIPQKLIRQVWIAKHWLLHREEVMALVVMKKFDWRGIVSQRPRASGLQNLNGNQVSHTPLECASYNRQIGIYSGIGE